MRCERTMADSVKMQDYERVKCNYSELDMMLGSDRGG